MPPTLPPTPHDTHTLRPVKINIKIKRTPKTKKPAKPFKSLTFYNACRSAPPAVVEKMIRAGAKVNKPFRKTGSKTPILAAVVRGNVAVVRILLNHGANVHGCPDIYPAAAKRNVLTVMEVLLENGLVIDDDHVLWTLVLRKQHKMVRVLLDYGANPNYYDAVGRHPLSKGRSLFSTAVETDDVDMVTLLVSKGADVRRGMCREPHPAADEPSGPLPVPDDESTPLTLPLIHAILRRSTGMIKLLLTKGCDVYAQDCRVRAEHEGAGASPEDWNKQGLTPMDYALTTPDVTRLFLEHGVCPNTLVRGCPPLIMAVIICHRTHNVLPNVLRLLLRHGANPLCETHHGHSIRFVTATCFGDPDAIPVLHQAMEAQRVDFLCRRRAVHQQHYQWGLDDTDDCLLDGTLIQGVVNEAVRSMPRKLFDGLCDMIA